MATYSAGTATIDVKPSLQGFAEECRAELQRFRIEFNVDVDADVSLARAQLEALARERTARIRVELDGAEEAEARLALLARNRTAHINVNVNGGNFTQINNNITNITNNAGRAERGLSSMGSVRFGGLASAITALVPALVGAVGAASALGGALAAIGGTAAVGLSGVGDAFKAMGDAASQSGSDAAAAANRIADAQDGVRRAQDSVTDAQKTAKQAQDDLNDSYEQASRALRDMNDQLADAELSQESAEIALARAQEARNKVYSDGKSSKLDRAEADNRVNTAAQRVKEARSRTADQREDTAEANAKGVGGSEIVTKAQDAKTAADKALTNAQVDLAKSMRDLADAQKGASAGADKYAEALAKLSPNARSFVQAMQALAPEWKNLRLAVQDRMFDGLDQSVTQFAKQTMPGLQTVMTGVAGHLNGAFKGTLTDLSKVFQQMAADGTMQRFIDSIGSALQGMAPMITGLVRMVSDATAAMGPSLGQFFSTLGNTLGTLGPALGLIGSQLLDALTPVLPVLGQLIQAISVGLGPALGPIGQLLGTLGTALSSMAAPLGTLLTALANGLAPIAQPLADLISALANGLAPILPSLGKLLGDLVAAVVPLIEPLLQLATAILQPMISILSAVVAALAPFIKQLAEQMKPVIDKLTPVLAEVGTIIGGALAQAIKELTPMLGPLVQAFLKLIEACLPLLPAWEEMVVSLLPPMVELLKGVLPIITSLIELFTKLVTEVIVPFLLPVFAQMSQRFKDMATDIREFVDGAKEKWNGLVDFVTGLPDRITNGAKNMWNGLKGNLVDVVNWVLTKWNSLAEKLTFTMPKIMGLGGDKVSVLPKAELLQKAAGGPVFGPGGPRADLIPAMLSNGEYVINAGAVAHYGVGMFDQLNTQRFADGGLATYGLPAGTSISYGQSDKFPEWVRALEAKFGVKASTYAGHQESDRGEAGYAPNPDRLNRGIDFSGTVEQLQKFAEALRALAPNTPALEQIIWQNPNTGQKIGWAAGADQSGTGYFASDYPGHQDHVHLRASAAISDAPAKPAAVDGQSVDGAYNADARDGQDGRNAPQKYTAGDGATTTSTTAATGSGPRSWSDVAGTFGEAFAKGQVSSFLSVFGIPDAMPPILTALGDLPSKIVKRPDNWTAPGLGQLTTPSTGGTQTNPLGDLVGKFVPGLANVVPAATSTAGPGAALPLTGQQGTPTAKTPVETLTSTLSAPAANYSGGDQATHDAAYRAFRESGLPADEWAPLVNLINNESDWNPTNKNPGSTAFGLGQFLDQTWATVGGTKTDDPYQQTTLMLKYIKGRPDYGTPSKAWELWQSRTPHWYANGGLVFGPGGGRSDLVPAWLSHGEYVVNAAQAALHMPALEAINAGARVTTPMPPTPAPSTRFALQADGGSNGNTVNYNNYIRTATVEDAFTQAQTRHDQQRAAQLANL